MRKFSTRTGRCLTGLPQLSYALGFRAIESKVPVAPVCPTEWIHGPQRGNRLPADAEFIQALGAALQSRGANVPALPAALAPNPFPLIFTFDGGLYRALIYVRRLTPQRGADTDHNRGEDEWHAQMIFDDSIRGRGVRNRLGHRPGYRTVLLGYLQSRNALVVVGWDAERRAEYAFSRSLQVREGTILQARRFGVGQQTSRRGEIVVAFRAKFFPEYLSGVRALHEEVEPAAEPPNDADIPADFFGPRDRRPLTGTRPVRDIRFKDFITAKYHSCAVCGMDSEILLQAAHIIGVAEPGGSDHPSNGLRLCRNCHALYDAGDLLIRSDYVIEFPHLDALGAHTVQTYRDFDGNSLRLPQIRPEYRPDPAKLAFVYERWRQRHRHA